jgi:hypothetical protein
MRSKEEHYELVQQLRAIVQDPENLKCTCPKTKCEWHGKCLECVALHRYHKDHMPNCLQQVFNDKIKAAAGIGEMNAVPKEQTPPEYWDYVRKRDYELRV